MMYYKLKKTLNIPKIIKFCYFLVHVLGHGAVFGLSWKKAVTAIIFDYWGKLV